MAASDKAIRRRAARNPDGKLAQILGVLDSQKEGSFRLLGSPDSNAPSEVSKAEPDSQGYIIHWRQGTSASDRYREQRKGKYRVSESFNNRREEDDDDDIYESIELKPGTSNAQLARQLARSGKIAYIEPNYIYTSQLIANDSYVASGLAWGSLGEPGIEASSFWSNSAEWAQYQSGPQTYIGIVDDGAFTQHNDLIGQFSNPGEALDGIDNDGNGLTDDIYGWNFATNTNNVYGGPRETHGTHVSGIAAALGGNGAGIAGVASESQLIATKFISSGRGTALDAIASLNYLADLKENGVNLTVVNCSWGGNGFSQGIYSAIERLNTLGVLVICAAGNNGTSRPMYPAAYDLPNIISVGAIDRTGRIASFSNRSRSWVDLYAPGSSIVSTVPGAGNRSDYALYSGTSMASPFVSGMAAVLMRMFPEKTHLEIKDAILNTAVRSASLQNWSVSGGTANLPDAIKLLGGNGTTTSNPSIPISAVISPSTANETNNNVITASISGAPGSSVTYAVSGISQADLSSGALSGNATLDNTGNATISWVIAADATTEGTETFALLLNGSSTAAASTSIQDTSTTPTSPAAPPPATETNPAPAPNPPSAAPAELWGTAASDTLIAPVETRISGVSQLGIDNGRGTIDVVTSGSSAPVTYVFGDARRGIYYNDGNARSIGAGDYLRVQNLKAGDILELVQASYVYTTNAFTGDAFLYLDTNNDGRVTSRGRNIDELIGVFNNSANLFASGQIGVAWTN